MSHKTRIALVITIILWASAFVGIRAGLQNYSPEGLALLRYLIASVCMGIIYFRLPHNELRNARDICAIMLVGAIGIGVYSIALNYGELHVSSGMASFIISQSPIITAIFAMFFLGEKISLSRLLGFFISVIGVAFIAIGEMGVINWNVSILYILLAAIAGGFYSVLQKPFLKRYGALEATAYVIWGGTIFLSFYMPQLQHDLLHATIKSTLTVAYLGVFPAAFAYICWNYALAKIPAARAASFLYFMPFVATLLGWLFLNEVPVWMSVFGGVLATFGVWLVNQSYSKRAEL